MCAKWMSPLESDFMLNIQCHEEILETSSFRVSTIHAHHYKIDSGLRLEEWSHYAAKSWWVINIIVATYFLLVFWHIHCGYKKSSISPFCLPSFVTNIKQVFIFTISSRLLHFISKFTFEFPLLFSLTNNARLSNLFTIVNLHKIYIYVL